MMSSGNIYKGISCPSAEQISRFKAGRFSVEEKQLLDAHIRECPFCEDALEGFALTSSDPVIINDTLHALVDQRTEEKRNGWGLKLAAAAIILAILSGGYYLLDSRIKKESVQLSAEKNIPLIPELAEENVPAESIADTSPETRRMVLADNVNKKFDRQEEVVITDNEKNEVGNVLQDSRGPVFQQDLSKAESEPVSAPAAAGVQVTGNLKTVRMDEKAAEMSLDEVAKETASDKFTEDTKLNISSEGKSASETRAFSLSKSAAKDEHETRKKSKKRENAAKPAVTGSVSEEYADFTVTDPLVEAEKLFELKKYSDCLLLLNGTQLKNKTDERYLWMLGKSYAETGNKAEAIKALEELLKIPSTAKRSEAESLLLELRK